MMHFYDACSEGMNLTQDDERTYWGIITEVKQSNAKIVNASSGGVKSSNYSPGQQPFETYHPKNCPHLDGKHA
jgi:hypothetical protein